MTAGNTGIGISIREQRERLGMTQEDLAQACMVSRQTISNWENGKTLPDIQSLTYLAEVIGITVDNLVGSAGHEIVRSVSADRRELVLLNYALLFLVLLSVAYRFAINETPRPVPDIAAIIPYLIILGGLVTIIIRMGVINRKHQLSNNQQIADYLVGDIEYGTKPRGIFQSYRTELTVLVVVIVCLVVGVLFELVSG